MRGAQGKRHHLAKVRRTVAPARCHPPRPSPPFLAACPALVYVHYISHSTVLYARNLTRPCLHSQPQRQPSRRNGKARTARSGKAGHPRGVQGPSGQLALLGSTSFVATERMPYHTRRRLTLLALLGGALPHMPWPHPARRAPTQTLDCFKARVKPYVVWGRPRVSRLSSMSRRNS